MTLETCANCGRRIGQLETPMVFEDQVVCTECHAKLRPVPIPKQVGPVIEDRAAPLRPKPKAKLFTVNKREMVALKRVKVVLDDSDTGQIKSDTMEVPYYLDERSLALAVEKHTGGAVKKIVILENFWVERDAASKLEGALLGIAIAGMFTNLSGRE